jgi:hypothetical protein
MLMNAREFSSPVLERLLEATAVELHGFYTGVEKIIERLVEYKMGSLPTGGSSHQDLLIMAKECGLLVDAHYGFLRDLGAVRHFVRHSYGKELDLHSLISTAEAVRDSWPALRGALTDRERELRQGSLPTE